MPRVRISTGKWAAGSELKLIEAVPSALVSAFKIPASDRGRRARPIRREPAHRITRRSERYTEAISSGSRRVRTMASENFSDKSLTTLRQLVCRVMTRASCLPPRKAYCRQQYQRSFNAVSINIACKKISIAPRSAGSRRSPTVLRSRGAQLVSQGVLSTTRTALPLSAFLSSFRRGAHLLNFSSRRGTERRS